MNEMAAITGRGFRPLLRRKEARALCLLLRIPRRTFERWCMEPPPLPQGMKFRVMPAGRKCNIYVRDTMLWLHKQTTTKPKR